MLTGVPYLSTISVFSHLVQIIILIPPFSRLRRYPFGVTSVLKNLHRNPFGQQNRSLMSSAAADTIHTEKKPAGKPQPGAKKDRPYRTKSRLPGKDASSQSTFTGKAKPSVSVTEQSYLRNLISVSTSYILLLPYRVSIAVLSLSVKHSVRPSAPFPLPGSISCAPPSCP